MIDYLCQHIRHKSTFILKSGKSFSNCTIECAMPLKQIEFFAFRNLHYANRYKQTALQSQNRTAKRFDRIEM